jgi:hypothetical protein
MLSVGEVVAPRLGAAFFFPIGIALPAIGGLVDLNSLRSRFSQSYGMLYFCQQHQYIKQEEN